MLQKLPYPLRPKRRLGHHDLTSSMPDVEEVRERLLLTHGDSWARRVCVTESGKYLLVGTGEDKLLAYELGTTPIRSRPLHGRAINSAVLAMSALRGNIFIVGYEDGSISTWDAKSGLEISREMVGEGRITSLTKMHEDSLVVGTGSGYVMMYQMKEAFVANQKWRARMHNGAVNALDSEGKMLVSGGGDKQVLIHEIEDGIIRESDRWVHDESVTDVAIGKKWIISASFDAIRVRHRNYGYEKLPKAMKEPKTYTGLHKKHWIHSVILMEEEDVKEYEEIRAHHEVSKVEEDEDENENENDRIGAKEFLITVGGDCGIVMIDLKRIKPLWYMNGRLNGEKLMGANSIWDVTLVPGCKIAICGPWNSNVVLIDVEDLLARESVSFWIRQMNIIRTASVELGTMIRSKTMEGFNNFFKSRNVDHDDSSSDHSWAQNNARNNDNDEQMIPEYVYGSPRALMQPLDYEQYDIQDDGD